MNWGTLVSFTSHNCLCVQIVICLLLLAAILFSGALPSHVLKVFGCASIDNHTFFDHQRHFLHPSIASIWKEHQANYLKELRKEKRGLILGGDGRADVQWENGKKVRQQLKSHLSPPTNIRVDFHNHVKIG